ncbi:SymE family type I addiction module toxin [Pseudomonas aeruginosa]|nr:SymE family type I addiction module toxin [Pseudomonas aeruginosa]
MATQKSPLSNSRLLTIGYQLYESRHSDWERRGKPRQIPYLRLSGDWLEAAGFEVGCKVCSGQPIPDSGLSFLRPPQVVTRR